MKEPLECIAIVCTSGIYVMQRGMALILPLTNLTVIAVILIALRVSILSLPSPYRSVFSPYGIMNFVVPRIYTLQDATIHIGWRVIPLIKGWSLYWMKRHMLYWNSFVPGIF